MYLRKVIPNDHSRMCFRMHENLGEAQATTGEKERIGRMVGSPEGLRNPHEMSFDTGNLFAIVVTKSRKTGPLRPRCNERLAVSRGERKSNFFNKLNKRGLYGEC